MRQTENIRQKAASIRGLARGRIRIGSFPSTSVRLLPGIMQQFQLNYPGIELVLLEGTDEEVYEWIQDGVVDLGFVTLPVSGVETVLVARDEELVIMSDKNPLRKVLQLTIQQIAHNPFIMSTRYRDTTIQDLFKDAGIEFNPKYKALGNATILGMVEENLGLTIFPEFVLPRKLKESGIVAIKLDPPLFRELALGVRSLSSLPPAVKMFIKTAQTWSVQHGYLRTEEVTTND
jgi:DNA-binding transcriptional LysR family regulator